MNDETPINEDNAGLPRRRRLPAPIEAAGFALQERILWPLQDRFAYLGPGPNRRLLWGGGGAAVVVAGVAAALALSGGDGASTPTTTAAEAPAQREPLAAVSAPAEPEPEPTPKKKLPHKTLHGAAPVFAPPSSESKGGKRSGTSKSSEAGAAKDGSASSDAAASRDASSGKGGRNDASAATETNTAATDSPSPAAARISSDPKRSADTASSGGPTAGAAAARAKVPAGPPAGPAALKVAREFAKGFVVYETGGEAGAFEDAFRASATPELTKALLQRPPKQPAGVKVPRAKVLNVVAGPSRGKVYKVSVSLLRVGVTSELRLDMEKTTKSGGKKGKRVEWRVTNVLG